jgi:decaprenyl-phosphate phosphoribosyltransferase
MTDRRILPTPPARPTLRGHVAILRIGHWVKNVFALPGIVIAWSLEPASIATTEPWLVAVGLVALCVVSSSNYVLNELLDAQYDRFHPTKHRRPAAAGHVSVPVAYVQWIALAVVGIGLGALVSLPFVAVLGVLWILGTAYNTPPVRTKDVPLLDVLSEAANNPVRMLAGWYLTGAVTTPPTSLLIGYWMVGAYFMVLKRFAEYRALGDPERLHAYRKPFRYYTERRLLATTAVYGVVSVVLLGIFANRYRPELLLALPLAAIVMAIYLWLGFKPDSPVQRPEELYRQPMLALAIGVCAAAIVVLLFIDLESPL